MPVATVQDVFDALERAVAFRDYAAIARLYADDAVVVTYSERNRPSSAEHVEGSAGVEAMWRETAHLDLEHAVCEEVIGRDGFAYVLLSEHPRGEREYGTFTCDVAGGKIVRQCGVVAWDE
jgi:ketosteroid isomerase-like protein